MKIICSLGALLITAGLASAEEKIITTEQEASFDNKFRYNVTTVGTSYPVRSHGTLELQPFWMSPLKDTEHRSPNVAKCLNDFDDQECCYNPCRPNPCLNGGTCHDSTASVVAFTCTCTDGFFGDHCGSIFPFTIHFVASYDLFLFAEPESCLRCDPNAVCTAEGQCECENGSKGSGSYCTAYCPPANFSTMRRGCEFNFSTISFAQSWENVTQYSMQTCDDGKRPAASIDCKTHLEYGVNVTKFVESSISCVPCDITLEDVLDETRVPENLTIAYIEDTAGMLVVLTDGDKTPNEIEDTVDLLGKMANELNKIGSHGTRKRVSPDTLKNVMLTAENIDGEFATSDRSIVSKHNIEPDIRESERDKDIRQSTHDLAHYISDFAHAVDLKDEKELTITTLRMAVKMVEIQEVDENSSDLIDEELAYVETKTGNAATSAPARKKVIRITIPSEALRRMNKIANSAGPGTLRLVFVIHRDASLLTVDERTGRVIDVSFQSGGRGERIDIGTDFITEYLQPPEPTPDQVAAIKNTRLKIDKKYFCVFWDFVRKEWSTVGCEFRDGPPATCTCTHFSSFALLLRVTTSLQHYELSTYNRIASSISAVCLLATVLIHLLVRDLRLRGPTGILINICLNLMGGFVLFSVGMDGKNKSFSTEGCYATAILMHITFLCSWFWTFVYSLNLCNDIVKVINPSPLIRNKIFMYSVGYGVPIFIVVTDLTSSLVLDQQPANLNDDNFKPRYIDTHVCWLRWLSMYLGFTTPVGMILFANFIIFFLVMRKLKTPNIRSSKDAVTATQQLLTAATLSTMMGLTWIFGYIMLLSTDDTFLSIFSIIFDVTNTCQGVAIFLVCCVRQEGVRKLWIMPILKCFHCKTGHMPRLRIKSADVSGTSSTAVVNTSNHVNEENQTTRM